MPLKRDICIDRNTNGVTYVSLRRMEQEKRTGTRHRANSRPGNKLPGAPVQSENDMHVDNDIPEQSQSRGHRR